MSDTIHDILQRPLATSARPLLGLTVLLVEDSRLASEAMRLFCLRSGARLRRANSLLAARRHLGAYRPSVVVVDLGLPDGSGSELIEDLSDHDPELPILAVSGDEARAQDAKDAGAGSFLAKPVPNLGAFQTAILSVLPSAIHPKGPRKLSGETVEPDATALQDDLAHAAELLAGPEDPCARAYVAQFLTDVARNAGDDALERAATTLRYRAETTPQLLAMLEARLADRPVI
ncbi:MAG: response regulator [Mangrovicoccus sp.]|nr:response regulator [Mangrovicoccus sp.]